MRKYMLEPPYSFITCGIERLACNAGQVQKIAQKKPQSITTHAKLHYIYGSFTKLFGTAVQILLVAVINGL